MKVFGHDNGIEKLTYAIRDEGLNTMLVKESLAKELRLNRQLVEFQFTAINEGSQGSGQSYSFLVQVLRQKHCLETSNALSVKDFTVAKSCIPSEDVAKWCHFDRISVPKLESSEGTIVIGADIPEAHWKLEETPGCNKEPYAVCTLLGWLVAGPLGTTPNNNVSSDFSMRRLIRCLRWTSASQHILKT